MKVRVVRKRNNKLERGNGTVRGKTRNNGQGGGNRKKIKK